MTVAIETLPDGTRTPAVRARATGLDYAYAFLLTATICALLVATTPGLWHWFVLPSGVCGVLIGGDTVRWARGRTGLFDPVGLIGAIGYHFFFLAPLLHVRWQQWPAYITGPGDWRPWLGAMALLNVGGLLIYRFTLAVLAARPSAGARPRRHWQLDPARLWPAFGCAIALAAAAEIYVWRAAGGLRGFEQAVVRQSSIAGLGWMLAIGESLPILCFAAWLIHARVRARRIRSLPLLAGFVAFVIAQFTLGGLRGSRGNLVWPVFIALGIIHLTVRPLSKRVLLTTTVLGLAFMYLYGFYKYEGFVGTYRFIAGERKQLELDSNRTVPALLLGDLGRADIQAFVLYRYTQPDSGYQLQYGTTYLAGVAALVPRSLWSSRPPGKLRAATDLMHGPGTYDRGYFRASNIYGIGGEALLNFGIPAIPLSYAVLAWAVCRFQRIATQLSSDDTRQYLIPIIGVLCLLLLTSDVGNVAYASLQFGLMLLAVLALGSRRLAYPR